MILLIIYSTRDDFFYINHTLDSYKLCVIGVLLLVNISDYLIKVSNHI